MSTFYCGGCGQFKERNERHPHRCIQCASTIVGKKAKRKRGKRRGGTGYTKHNLEPKDFAQLISSQKERCKICRKKGYLELDHAHSCCVGKYSCGKCIRGLLCPQCNSKVYMVEEDRCTVHNMRPEWFKKIEAYLDNSGFARHKYRQRISK